MTIETLDHARERLRPVVERAESFSGWSGVPSPRPLGAEKPWSYSGRARELLASATSVLDLGTGGGERFSRLLDGFVGRAVATEEWAVNAPIAAAGLRGRAEVVRASAFYLPFLGASFGLILSRHEAIYPAEIARLLAPGGVFLTQQTWRYMEELHYYIPRKTDFGDHFHGYASGLHASGLQVIDAREHVAPHAFSGLEDLVFLLGVAPWEVPDFDPLGRDLQALLALERDLTGPDGLVITCGHYIIEAHKPV
ncbi:MAG TPA: methyltransferase domain-containing protein [Dehalococcoidia bacterium]|jgi:SAM-dependent methyltransferase|nr:methyltransferase domain-containing protein [Dehalococcoidia bacterium]